MIHMKSELASVTGKHIACLKRIVKCSMCLDLKEVCILNAHLSIHPSCNFLFAYLSQGFFPTFLKRYINLKGLQNSDYPCGPGTLYSILTRF